MSDNDNNNLLDKLIKYKLQINKLQDDKLIRNKKEETKNEVNIEQLKKNLGNKNINLTDKNNIILTLHDQIEELKNKLQIFKNKLNKDENDEDKDEINRSNKFKKNLNNKDDNLNDKNNIILILYAKIEELKKKLILLENKLDKDENDEEELKFFKDKIIESSNQINKLKENILLRNKIIEENKIFKIKMEEINKMNLVKTYELLFCILEKLYKISLNKNKIVDPLTKLDLLNKKISNIKQTVNNSDEIAFLKKENYDKYLSFKEIFRSLLKELKKKMIETKIKFNNNNKS